MREIKFRLWCINKNEWEKDLVLLDLNGKIFQVKNNYNFPCKTETHILMQYTGLKDKNGVEIYEGDIVSTGEPYDKYSRIVWRDYGFEFTWSNERTGSMPITCIGDVEVIGNIYENPELLEVKNKS